MKLKLLYGAGLFALGVVAGGYLFADVQPRSFLALPDCRANCYHLNELAGLMAAAGIQRGGTAIMPLVVKETDRCIAIRYPFASREIHYVIFPKKDIKDIADIAADDQPYVLDCLGLVRALVQEQGLRDYRLYTNGPDEQDVRYLHFHLIAWDVNGADKS
jgi:diadenosine tetraphosphate (Ap4A) HIT family hydrolase